MLVLDRSDAVAEARILHPQNLGYFTVGQKFLHEDGGRRPSWKERHYPMHSLEQVLGAVKSVPDLYISQASFVAPKRGNALVQNISCAFIDLDCYKLGLRNDESTIEALLIMADRVNLPRPSYIMNSGQGLYAKWIFKQPISGGMLPHWTHLQEVLIRVFATLGTDIVAKDLARVLRASSTVNSKGGIVEVVNQTGQTYNFQELAAAAARIDLPEMIQESRKAARQIRLRQDDLAMLPSDLGALTEYAMSREPILMQRLSRQSLNWSRFLDMRDIMIRRGGLHKGCRDVFLFYMVSHLGLAGVINPQNFWGEVDTLLRAFPLSKDFDPLQDGTLKTLKQRIEANARGERIAFKGTKVTPIYTPSNQFLIDALQIADDEMQNLRTLISSQEKQRRADLKVPGRAERREARQEARELAAKLREDGLNNTQISQHIGVAVSTVGRWLADPSVNKTRGHQQYLRANKDRWDAERIRQWDAKRKERHARARHELEQLREQQAQLNAAREAQGRLKTGIILLAITQKMGDRSTTSDSQDAPAVFHRLRAAGADPDPVSAD